MGRDAPRSDASPTSGICGGVVSAALADFRVVMGKTDDRGREADKCDEEAEDIRLCCPGNCDEYDIDEELVELCPG